MKKILCPVDVYQAPEEFAGSKVFACSAELALAFVANASATQNAESPDEPRSEIIFVYVALPDPPNIPTLSVLPQAIDHSIELEKLQQICSMKAVDELTAANTTYSDLKIRITTRLEQGLPGPTIVELAEAENVDWIVMATHGRTGLSRLLIGSVAEYVLRHAPCPVATVRS